MDSSGSPQSVVHQHGGSGVSARRVGLGRYRNGAYWFPGIVQSDNSGRVTIAYDNGDRETLPANLVKAYNWGVGTRVECNWKNGGTWYAGKITALRGGAVSIAYDDGDKENTSTGKCRSR